MEFDHCTRNGACEFYKRSPFFVREIKRNHSFLKRNREGGGGGTRISRVSRGKKNRIGISISFQSEIKGRLNADTLRSIEGRVDIAAWKITEGARGRRVRRGSRGKRTWKTNGRRGKGEGEDERDGRREKRRLAADSTVTERDKEKRTRFYRLLPFDFILLPRHKPLHPSRRFLYRETRNLSRYVGSEI